MTVGELKVALEGVPDHARVEVPVRVFTRRYPVTYVTPFEAKHFQTGNHADGHPGEFRIWISLGEGLVVQDRRPKEHQV